MPRDDFEPADDEGRDDGSEAVSKEDRELIAAVNASGMSRSELLSRATRDWEREKAQQGDTGGSGGSSGNDDEDEDGGRVVTRAEMKEMAKREQAAAQKAANDAAMRQTQYAALQDEIADVMNAATDFADADEDDVAAVEKLVRQELIENPKLAKMGRLELRRATRKAASHALDKLRKKARQRAGVEVGEDEDRDSRLAGRATGEGAGTGSGRSSARPKAREVTSDGDVPGLGGLGGIYPGEKDLDETHDRLMADFRARERAGK